MAKRKNHSPEEIVRKLATADRLSAEGAGGEEVARKLGISSGECFFRFAIANHVLAPQGR
jgi:hypothetical protein